MKSNIKTQEGHLIGTELKLNIITSRFNEFITGKLLEGALDGLTRHGVKEENITITKVPGAFEIPLIAKKAAETKKYNAIICLGAIIRGSTTHYEHVANEVTKGIAAASLETGTPIIFGVLTTENIEQAIERAGTKSGNKGFDAATTAIEIANLINTIQV